MILFFKCKQSHHLYVMTILSFFPIFIPIISINYCIVLANVSRTMLNHVTAGKFALFPALKGTLLMFHPQARCLLLFSVSCCQIKEISFCF